MPRPFAAIETCPAHQSRPPARRRAVVFFITALVRASTSACLQSSPPTTHEADFSRRRCSRCTGAPRAPRPQPRASSKRKTDAASAAHRGRRVVARLARPRGVRGRHECGHWNYRLLRSKLMAPLFSRSWTAYPARRRLAWLGPAGRSHADDHADAGSSNSCDAPGRGGPVPSGSFTSTKSPPPSP